MSVLGLLLWQMDNHWKGNFEYTFWYIATKGKAVLFNIVLVLLIILEGHNEG